VTWGDCHYAQKVKNAENAGAKMILVVLNHDMAVNHAAIRQLTINTNVEVLAVDHTDGQKLIDYINDAKNNNTKDANIELTYSYDIEKHVNYQNTTKVLVDYWFSSGDVRKDSYNFLETFHDVLKDFGDLVTFTPHYVLWEQEGVDDPKICLSKGKYCDPEPLIENKIPGADAVTENLRQICFRELNTNTTVDDVWWKYVTAFGAQCVDQIKDELAICRDKILADISPKVMDEVDYCMRHAFDERGESQHLTREYNLKEEMHIDHYPALYVNKQRYTESSRNRNAMREFICTHFTQDQLPAPCVATSAVTTMEQYNGTDVGVYIALVAVSVVVMVVMIYCVRRSVKRQVMFRMNDEISHIVTQYKQFKDKSNSFSIDDDA